MASVPPPPVASLATCPAEIIASILGCLADRKKDLLRVSRTCRNLRAAAEPLIYREIRWLLPGGAETPEVFLLVRTLLERGPDLARHVQVLEAARKYGRGAGLGQHPDVHRHERFLRSERDVALFASAVRELKVPRELEELWISQLCGVGSMYAALALLLVKMPNLRTLWLGRAFLDGSERILSQVLRYYILPEEPGGGRTSTEAGDDGGNGGVGVGEGGGCRSLEEVARREQPGVLAQLQDVSFRQNSRDRKDPDPVPLWLQQIQQRQLQPQRRRWRKWLASITGSSSNNSNGSSGGDDAVGRTPAQVMEHWIPDALVFFYLPNLRRLRFDIDSAWQHPFTWPGSAPPPPCMHLEELQVTGFGPSYLAEVLPVIAPPVLKHLSWRWAYLDTFDNSYGGDDYENPKADISRDFDLDQLSRALEAVAPTLAGLEITTPWMGASRKFPRSIPRFAGSLGNGLASCGELEDLEIPWWLLMGMSPEACTSLTSGGGSSAGGTGGVPDLGCHLPRNLRTLVVTDDRPLGSYYGRISWAPEEGGAYRWYDQTMLGAVREMLVRWRERTPRLTRFELDLEDQYVQDMPVRHSVESIPEMAGGIGREVLEAATAPDLGTGRRLQCDVIKKAGDGRFW
ncbi:hypothetical protein Micbo1qcDRAFT_197318 [Microdochium bolleyi]|uniref:F-box domain-containing protein n=1 Tax=Microdochium bolleyi TaxID=196109 RepID=A0A136IUL6_9PEZI|nr:hypothetical protein Micbo1qcDRAFT_197318 [Microdochium bolleyi]